MKDFKHDTYAMTVQVVDWIKPMIPDAERDSMNTAIKMADEVSELQHAIYTKGKNVGEELADVMILLLDIAYLHKVDIAAEFASKMEINQNRRWKERNGSLTHKE